MSQNFESDSAFSVLTLAVFALEEAAWIKCRYSTVELCGLCFVRWILF